MKSKIVLVPSVEMFSHQGGQPAPDAVVSDEYVVVSSQAALGFNRFVLSLQDVVGDDLHRTHTGHIHKHCHKSLQSAGDRIEEN